MQATEETAEKSFGQRVDGVLRKGGCVCHTNLPLKLIMPFIMTTYSVYLSISVIINDFMNSMRRKIITKDNWIKLIINDHKLQHLISKNYNYKITKFENSLHILGLYILTQKIYICACLSLINSNPIKNQ